MPDHLPRKIIIRSVNWLGDAVMTLPSLALLHEAFPEAHLSLLCPQKLSGLWEKQSFIHSVLPFENHASVFTVGRIAKEAGVNAALIFPNSPRSAIECWLSGISIRMGYRCRWRKLFLSHALPNRQGIVSMRKRTPQEVQTLLSGETKKQGPKYPAASHHIYHYLHLTKEFIKKFSPSAKTIFDPTPRLEISTQEQAEIRNRFGIQPSSPRTLLLGVNAGAEYGPAKRWPLSSFAQTMASLSQKLGAEWLLFGGKGDLPLAEELRKQATQRYPEIKINTLTGRTTLHELAVLSSLCHVFLTNDTGPMHVAAAAGSTVVVPFLSTSAELTCPGVPLDWKTPPSPHLFLRPTSCPCSPCFLKQCPADFRCAKEISPQNVIEAISQKIASSQQSEYH